MSADGASSDLALLLMNAKNQVTLWGPEGEIQDYASKFWNGLVGTYHRQRWETFIQRLVLSLDKSDNVPDDYSLHKDMLKLGEKFCDDQSATFSTIPRGDTLDIIRTRIFDKFDHAESMYDCYDVDASVLLHAPRTVPKNLIVWTRVPAQLATLCTLDSLCLAFVPDQGALLSNLEGLHSSPKRAGIKHTTKLCAKQGNRIHTGVAPQQSSMRQLHISTFALAFPGCYSRPYRCCGNY